MLTPEIGFASTVESIDSPISYSGTTRPDALVSSGRKTGRKSRGAYSHDTALSLHELSDMMPSKLHMTVPREFRRNSKIPEILVIHHAQSTQVTFRKCSGYV